MNSDQGAAQVIEQLETLRVNYMLVGAFSSNIYGIPRSTKDADIVVAFDTIQIVEFCERLGQDLTGYAWRSQPEAIPGFLPVKVGQVKLRAYIVNCESCVR